MFVSAESVTRSVPELLVSFALNIEHTTMRMGFCQLLSDAMTVPIEAPERRRTDVRIWGGHCPATKSVCSAHLKLLKERQDRKWPCLSFSSATSNGKRFIKRAFESVGKLYLANYGL